MCRIKITPTNIHSVRKDDHQEFDLTRSLSGPPDTLCLTTRSRVSKTNSFRLQPESLPVKIVLGSTNTTMTRPRRTTLFEWIGNILILVSSTRIRAPRLLDHHFWSIGLLISFYTSQYSLQPLTFVINTTSKYHSTSTPYEGPLTYTIRKFFCHLILKSWEHLRSVLRFEIHPRFSFFYYPFVYTFVVRSHNPTVTQSGTS